MGIEVKKTAIVLGAAGGVAALSLLGVAGLQVANAASSQPSTGASQEGPGGMRGQGGPRGAMMSGRGLGEPVHGQTVVKDGDAYKTVQMQAGAITAVSATSITVKSSDDFTGTYAITSDTKVIKDGNKVAATDLTVGEAVHVNGVKSGATITANHIMVGAPPQRGQMHRNGGNAEGA